MKKFVYVKLFIGTSQVVLVVKNLTWVHFLGREDSLEEEMAPDSSILAWEILWTEDLLGLQSMGPQRLGQD